GGEHAITVRTPGEPWGRSYEIVATTAERGELPVSPLDREQEFSLPGRSVTLMRCDVPTSDEALAARAHEEREHRQTARTAVRTRAPRRAPRASTRRADGPR
ncbi:MAG: hypothetical protein M0Z51_09770, partial [Propionibacterium sp.]|nr:hypothetical protein [Propionibacterium sp.]